MASPVTPSLVRAAVPQANGDVCLTQNRAMLQIPLYFYKFINWLFNADGNFSTAARAQVWPAGAIMEYAGSGTPVGNWLECAGQLVSRTTYVDLFTAIGTAYGAGDASTTFAVPDKRGRAGIGSGQLVNADASTGVTYVLGTKYGEEEHELIQGEIPDVIPSAADNTNKIFTRIFAGGGNAPVGGGGSYDGVDVEDVFKGEDNADAHENRGPRLCVRFFIAY